MTRHLGAGLLALTIAMALGNAHLAPIRPQTVEAITPTKTPVSPDGIHAVCDLPADQHMRNSGGSDGPRGPGSGSGLCVPTSVEVAARWQNVRAIDGLQRFCQNYPGGSYPQKLAATLKAFCKAKGVAVPHYIQHTGGDLAFLDMAIKTRRMPGVTYSGHDGFYRGFIGHMVDLAHLDEEHSAIIDNNRPGQFVWMTRDEFAQRWREMSGGWAFVWLAPPPPPGPSIVGDCPNGRCPITPLKPIDPNEVPAPIGVPPSADHEWGPIPGHGWGWRFKVKGGVEPRRIDGSTHRYWIDGVEVTRDQAYQAFGDEGLTDDSDRPSLSIVAGEGKADVVEATLADPRIAALAGKCHVQIYAPDSWVAKTRLTAAVTLHAPASKGGKLLGTAAGSTIDDLLDLLRPFLDPLWKPAPAPAPEPHPAPSPSPSPSPAPPSPSPCPSPCPCPPGPDGSPCGPRPNVFLTILAAVLAWFAKPRE